MTSIEGIARIATGGSPLRVWSLIVTVFGDLAPGEDDWLPSALLGQLTQPLGVRPEALRVALHRLRKDGWLESRRDGRASAHRLSASARTESRTAAPRIYGTKPPRGLWLVLNEPGSRLPDGITWLAPGIGLSPKKVAGFCEIIEPGSLAPWMREQTVPADLIAECARAADCLQAILSHAQQKLAPQETTTLRLLAVHVWRRIALKTPALPDEALPPDWRGAEAQARLQIIIERLPKPKFAALCDFA